MTGKIIIVTAAAAIIIGIFMMDHIGNSNSSNSSNGSSNSSNIREQMKGKKEKFAPYNNTETVFKPTLMHSDIACNVKQPQIRYMYQAIPPARNSSYDIRNPPHFIESADKETIGIFGHTDIFGNIRDERICPNFKKMKNAILS